MNMYELPEIKVKRKKKKPSGKRNYALLVALVILCSSFFGFLAGSFSVYYFVPPARKNIGGEFDFPQIIEKETVIEKYLPQTTHEEAIIGAVKEVSSAVVSIVVSKDVPIIEKRIEEFGLFEIEIPHQEGFEKQEIGGGTGFIVSEDGLVLTNKHVVLEEAADYTVFLKNGDKYPAEVLARDPFQDIAVLEIKRGRKVNDEGRVVMETFPVANLGDSDSLEIGQVVIAIGNALGEFRNTVSSGVVSGLGRSVVASSGNYVETLEDVIQTDAAINRGNSGGPLLNLNKEVIGINTAMVSGAQSIGFAIPVNKAKRDIEQVKKEGRIFYPFLGVRYVLINDEIKEEEGLSADYGALIISGEGGESAVVTGSAAAKSDIREGDIILEMEGEKITEENSLSDVILDYNPGDRVSLKILRNGQEINKEVVLGEKSS